MSLLKLWKDRAKMNSHACVCMKISLVNASEHVPVGYKLLQCITSFNLFLYLGGHCGTRVSATNVLMSIVV